MTMLTFDKINASQRKEDKSTKRKAIPYVDYFEEMDISEEQKKERIELAEMLDDVFFYLFALAKSSKKSDDSEDLQEELEESLSRRLTDALEEYGIKLDKDPYWGEYVGSRSHKIARTTAKRLNDPYYTSDDRAKVIAENEANAIMNHQEFADAIKQGYTSKLWISEQDSKVRPHHRKVDDGKPIPIGSPFVVGSSYMMYPMDDSLGADDNEIVGCRCSVDFGFDFEDEIDDSEENELADEQSEELVYNKFNHFHFANMEAFSDEEMLADIKSSEIGRELLKVVIEKDIPTTIVYGVDVEFRKAGSFIDGVIYIYAPKDGTLEEAMNTFIHEATHVKINAPNSFAQELECYLNEYRHRGREITQDTIDELTKFINENYDF